MSKYNQKMYSDKVIAASEEIAKIANTYGMEFTAPAALSTLVEMYTLLYGPEMAAEMLYYAADSVALTAPTKIKK